MSFAEVAYRGHQETAKLIERVTACGRYPDPAALLQSRAPAIAMPGAALRLVRDIVPRRFFGGAGDPEALSALRERLPVECADLVGSATDTGVGHRFDLLGYQMLWFGEPIDWHFDPVWDRQSPLVHWSRIDALDPALVGDSKVIWELNRHQWIVRLAQSWALTRDEQTAQACIGSIDAWLEANPPGTGINWTSSLEVAYRLISWCWTLVLLRDFPRLSGEWMMKVISAIWMHAAHVRRYLRTTFPNTHLGRRSVCFTPAPCSRNSSTLRWRELARILVEVGTGLLTASTSSSRLLPPAPSHLPALSVGVAQRRRVPGPVAGGVGMVEFSPAPASGSIPAIGDVDGGTLLLSRRRQTTLPVCSQLRRRCSTDPTSPGRRMASRPRSCG
jgi:hypothetical protein